MYDAEVSCLDPAFADQGITLVEVEWRGAPASAYDALDGVLLLAAWDYQDHADHFLEHVKTLAGRGLPVWNPPEMIAWNIRKTYLRDLAAAGVPVIPTIWMEQPAWPLIAGSFESFDAQKLVVKRQVGAGAHGQLLVDRNTIDVSAPAPDRPVMLQPFLASVAEEGEFSFLFVDGDLSHVVLKRAAPGDYRIQPRYGGISRAITPAPADTAAARSVLEVLGSSRGGPPLYARVDMARAADGKLLLMELELFEPFLFPKEGPGVGPMLARALRRRLG